MVDGKGIGDRGLHITNNHNSNIIRRKESGKTRRKRKNEAGKRGYLRQHLAVTSLTEKEQNKRIYIYIQARGEGMGWGCSFPTARLHHQPWAESHTLWCTKWSSPSRSHQGSPHWHQDVEPEAEGPYGVLLGREKDIKRGIDGKLFYQLDGQCSAPKYHEECLVNLLFLSFLSYFCCQPQLQWGPRK